jgi:hypothetical protein
MLCLPLAARGLRGDEHGRPGRGHACALGEDASAALLPEPRRKGESLTLALAGTPRPAAEKLRELTGSSDSVWLELSPLDRGGVDDGPLAERIRTAASVTLIEGKLLDWLVTLWPARRNSAVLGALAECAYTGGRLIGRGSTAILVAAGGVVRGPTRDEPGESRVGLSNPRESGEARMAQGLHLCGDTFVDTQARSGGSLLRLLSTMIEHHEDHGVHLGARSSLCCDLETRSWVSLGADPLIALDLSGSRRLAERIEGAQISVLASGDGWRARDRSLFSSGEAIQFGAGEKVVDADGLSLSRLLGPPLESRISTNDRMRVELRQGTLSLAFTGPDGAAPRAQRLLLDVALARGRWGELGA